MTIIDDIYRRPINERFRYKPLNEVLAIISMETLGSKGYEVFFDGEPSLFFSGGVIQLLRINGQVRMPIDIYYYRGVNKDNGHTKCVIHYNQEEYENDARLLAESIFNNLGLHFDVFQSPKKNGNSNGSKGNGNSNH